MNDTPEASNAPHGHSIQASRATSSDEFHRHSFTRPGHDVGFGVRRGHSDGEVIQPHSDTGHSSWQFESNRQQTPSAQHSSQGLWHPHDRPHMQRHDSWNDFLQNFNNTQNLQEFLNSHGGPDDERARRARQQALMMLTEQRKRAREARDVQSRRRSSTMLSPQGRPIGLRRHAASASASTDSGSPNNSPYHHRTPSHHDMRPLPSPPVPHRQGSRSDEHVVPRWQPDSEVSSCPICQRPFTFFFRKHHCRKCGRVVCANCSPHRITIPRQFIVHPPDEGLLGSDGSGDSDGGNGSGSVSMSRQLHPALGGGQEVRLCNPCVPDPNPMPPPSYNQSPPTNEFVPFPRHDAPAGRRHGWSASYSSSGPRRHSATLDAMTSTANPFEADRGSQRPNPLASPGGRHPQHYLSNPLHPGLRSPYGSAPDSRSSYLTDPRRPYHRSHHRQHASIAAYPSSHYRSMLDITAPSPAPVPQTPPSPPPPPPRQIPEEDECPICHNELPPKGPNGEEIEREAHVASCIESHFSTSRPRSDQPAPEAAVAAAVAATSASPAQAGAGQEASSTAVAGPSTRRRTTGMVVYQATEKDCIGEDGAIQECVICFEDFEPGTEMGRLECLCKFHKTCIRSWWDTKGAGACPVHQGGLI